MASGVLNSITMARLIMFAMLALPLLACSGSDTPKDASSSGTVATDDDTTVAEDGADANNADTDAQLLGSSLVASSATSSVGLASVSPSDLTTADVGSDIHALFLPRACAVATATSATEATYTFTKCLGPNGLLGVSGTVVVDYTATADSLTLSLTFKTMTLNGATFDGSAKATVTADGAKRSMTWSGAINGKTANEKTFDHTSNSTVAWTVGDKCFALSGTSDGKVNAREIRTEIDDYSRCGRGCPEAGGKIVVTNVAKNKSYAIDFDGTATATYTSPNGRQTAIPLICKA